MLFHGANIEMRLITLIGVTILLLSGCSTTGPENMSNELSPCPATPNCVCSDSDGMVHGIAALQLKVDAGVAWSALVTLLEEDQSMTVITNETNDYLRAEARTAFFGFVDDVEFKMRPDVNEIGMRSASRVGLSDLGKNRRRLENIRTALAAQGIVVSR
jgi:uncharacterized protein (DUF1499 family)